MSGAGDPCPSTPVVVMGVSGSGKTTTGAALAQRWGRVFIDADDLHPAMNKAKMAAGTPLTDVDRAPWLSVVSKRLAPDDHRAAPVIACSALKRKYRDLLRASAPDTIFVHLEVDVATLRHRIKDREHEYMPPSLLASQLTTLEPLASAEHGVSVDATASLAELIDTITTAVESRPSKETQA